MSLVFFLHLHTALHTLFAEEVKTRVKLQTTLANILPVVLSDFISLSRIGPAHHLGGRLPRTSSVPCYDLRNSVDGVCCLWGKD